MKIKIKKDEIIKGVGKVIAAINQRSTLPILSNILIESQKDNSIQLTGTDLEIGIITNVDAVVEEEGAITVPAKKFTDIVREAPSEDIEISVTKNNSISIKSGKAFFKLMGLPKDDYPKFPQFNKEKGIEIDNTVLKECISLTAFAISSDETRYVLNGALLILKEKTFQMIATDGRRLAVIKKDVSIPKGITLEVIVPTKAIYEVSKNIQGEGKVTVIELGNQVVFCVGNSVIISRLIEGHFPNYEQVIPKETTIEAEVDRNTFLSMIRRVSLLTSLESQAVKVDIVKGNKMIVSSRSPNIGESKEEIDINVHSGGDITIGFNPGYIIDVLKNLDIDTITLQLSSPEKPGMITGKEGYVYVIMPMQIG